MFLRGVSGFELIIVLVIVVLLFGVGRVSKLGKEMGSAISEFRKGLQDGIENDENDESDDNGQTS